MKKFELKDYYACIEQGIFYKGDIVYPLIPNDVIKLTFRRIYRNVKIYSDCSIFSNFNNVVQASDKLKKFDKDHKDDKDYTYPYLIRITLPRFRLDVEFPFSCGYITSSNEIYYYEIIYNEIYIYKNDNKDLFDTPCEQLNLKIKCQCHGININLNHEELIDACMYNVNDTKKSLKKATKLFNHDIEDEYNNTEDECDNFNIKLNKPIRFI